MTQTQNQFTITPNKGQLALAPNDNTLNCQVAAAEAGTLVAGQAVIIDDVAGDQIAVEAAAAIDGAIFGFIPYGVKTNEYTALDQVKVARDGDVMYMEASAAIARGASVEIVLSGSKVATLNTGTSVGVALDKAAADGDLIRVQIKI